jgi:RNA polymerase sigma-70 factor (ECF subfamily)
MDSVELGHITACQRGELEHFDPLYLLHVDAVYKYLYRRTLHKATAEDLTSTTFLKAIESVRSFDTARGSEFRGWLYRIARNALIDHYRRLRKTVDIESVWDLESFDDSTDVAAKAIDAKALHEALQKLTPAQREIVLLRAWEGLSYKEIAALTGKTEGNAKVLFSRAISDLRAHMPTMILLLLFPHLV